MSCTSPSRKQWYVCTLLAASTTDPVLPFDSCPLVSAGACSPNPCENGGSCSVDPAGGRVCSCTPGFGGMSCQTDTSCELHRFQGWSRKYAREWSDQAIEGARNSIGTPIVPHALQLPHYAMIHKNSCERTTAILCFLDDVRLWTCLSTVGSLGPVLCRVRLFRDVDGCSQGRLPICC